MLLTVKTVDRLELRQEPLPRQLRAGTGFQVCPFQTYGGQFFLEILLPCPVEASARRRDELVVKQSLLAEF